MNELILSLYFLIGFLIGIWRISKVTNEEDSFMALALWPLYLVYKAVKKYYKKNKV